MKILLIEPPGKNKGLNTGLGYLAAVCKRDGHKVMVLDTNNREPGGYGSPNSVPEDSVIDEMVKKAMADFNPEMVGVSVKSFTADISARIYKVARQCNPKVITVVGGPHVSLDGYPYLEKNNIDFGFDSEAEVSFPQLIKALESGDEEQFTEIGGLIYRRQGELVCNQREAIIKELDDLPLPDYTDFTSVQKWGGHIYDYPLLTSRGCPYMCTYCSLPSIMGRKWRSQSATMVLKEIKYAIEKHGISRFSVVDDNFTLHRDRAGEICDAMIANNINIPWTSQNGIRADKITEELARKMRQAGCRHVWIGIEAADEELFETINKGERLPEVRDGIKKFLAAGIGVGGFFIVGMPYATREKDLKTVDFVKELGIDAWWFNFVPYPYTAAYDWVVKNAKILRPIDGIAQYGSGEITPVFETEEYKAEQRMQTYEEIHVRMGFFDRLFDPDQSYTWNLSKSYQRAAKYGLMGRKNFAAFTVKHAMKQAMDRMKLRKWDFGNEAPVGDMT